MTRCLGIAFNKRDRDRYLWRLTIYFEDSRKFDSWSTGYAYYYGGPMTVRIDRAPSAEQLNKRDLAATIVHELGHVKGVDHKDMMNLPRYSRRAKGHREFYSFADEFEIRLIEKKLPRKKTLEEKHHERLAVIDGHLKEWERKHKLATTKLKNWKRKKRELEYRMKRAAVAAGRSQNDE